MLQFYITSKFKHNNCYLSAPAIRCGTSDCNLQNEFHRLVQGYIKVIPIYITSDYNFAFFFFYTDVKPGLSLTLREEHSLKACEKIMLRKLCGPKTK
jgi:hypothetical protein